MLRISESTGRYLLAASLFLLLCGCQSPTMKGTPFYTGEYESPAEGYTDRVNLWPLLYYRDPALSVLWPFFEHTDSHTALRPLYSVYNRGTSNAVYNICWPLACFDAGKQANYIFPVYWGRDSFGANEYFIVIPLYWHLDDPFNGAGVNALFPLWIWSIRDQDRRLHIFWPVYANETRLHDRLWRIWPFYGIHSKRDGEEISLFWAWPLGGSLKSLERNEHYFFPVYYAGNRGLENDFWTLFGGRSVGPDRTRWAVFPALSWGETSGTCYKNYYLGALGKKERTENGTGSYLLPFFARRQTPDSGYFFSIPWSAASASDGSAWHASLPLFYERTGASGDNLLLTMLYSRKKDAENHMTWRCFFPLLYLDETYDAHFMTLLGGRWRAADRSGWLALPILSGGVKHPESGGTVWAAGLAGRMYDTEKSSHYVLPFYYSCPEEDRFLSIPFMRWQADDRTRYSIIPLLLSGTSRKDGTVKTAVAAGIASWEKEGNQLNRSAVFPFYSWKRDDYLYTLLYGKDKTMTYFMTPVIGRYLDKKGGWVFPFWQHKETESRKETDLLLGFWNRYEEKDRSGQSLFLVYNVSQSRYEDHRDESLVWQSRNLTALLLLWNNRKILAGPGEAVLAEHSSSGFFPLWSRCTDMSRDGEKTVNTSDILLRLYDFRRETPHQNDGKPYTRCRVLWRLYHRETLGGDSSTDIFPAVTIDRNENGFRKYSFLWRLFRYETDPQQKTSKLDVLFIPLKR